MRSHRNCYHCCNCSRSLFRTSFNFYLYLYIQRFVAVVVCRGRSTEIGKIVEQQSTSTQIGFFFASILFCWFFLRSTYLSSWLSISRFSKVHSIQLFCETHSHSFEFVKCKAAWMHSSHQQLVKIPFSFSSSNQYLNIEPHYLSRSSGCCLFSTLLVFLCKQSFVASNPFCCLPFCVCVCNTGDDLCFVCMCIFSVHFCFLLRAIS